MNKYYKNMVKRMDNVKYQANFIGHTKALNDETFPQLIYIYLSLVA